MDNPKQKPKKRKRLLLTTRIKRVAQTVLRILDWMLSVMERLLVLGIGSCVVYLGIALISGHAVKAGVDLVTALNQNWKVLLLLLIPLFYQTIRMFLEEAQEAWGVKRRSKLKSNDEETTPEKLKG